MSRVLEETAKRGISPDAVAAVIERALGSRRMRARYLVGRDARMILTAPAAAAGPAVRPHDPPRHGPARARRPPLRRAAG